MREREGWVTIHAPTGEPERDRVGFDSTFVRCWDQPGEPQRDDVTQVKVRITPFEPAREGEKWIVLAPGHDHDLRRVSDLYPTEAAARCAIEVNHWSRECTVHRVRLTVLS